MARGDLTEEQWERIAPLFPVNSKGRGGWWKSHRKILNGIRWRLRTGSPWRDVPRRRFGPWQTVYTRFNRWSKDGTWDRVLRDLQHQDEEKGRFDHTVWCIDGSVVRAHVSAAGAKKGIQGIMTTKHLAGLGEGSPPNSTCFVIERGQG